MMFSHLLLIFLGTKKFRRVIYNKLSLLYILKQNKILIMIKHGKQILIIGYISSLIINNSEYKFKFNIKQYIYENQV